MKKRMHILFTLLLSLFVFVSRVEADDDKVMYLECAYGDKSYVFTYITNSSTNAEFASFTYRVFSKDNLGGFNESNDPNTSSAPGIQAGMANSYSEPVSYWIKDVNKFDSCVNDIKKCDNKYTAVEINQNFSKGICPEKFTIKAGVGYAGGTTTNYIEKNVLKSNFVIYGHNGTTYYEGYTGDGNYIVLSGPGNIQKIKPFELSKAQHNALRVSGSKYFDLSIAENRYSNGSMAQTYISTNNIGTHIDNWINKGYATALMNQVNISSELKSNHSKILNACSNLNETKEYNFDSYSSTDMVNDLASAYNTLSQFYSGSNVYIRCSNSKATNDYLESLYDCTLYNALGYTELTNGNFDEAKYLNTIILNNFRSELLNRYPNINNTDEMDGYLETLYRCSISLDSPLANLSEDDQKKIDDLRGRLGNLATKQNMAIVEDCESLIGTDLIVKVKSITNIIKIAIPILLILFGIYEYGMVIFSGDNDKMKKANKQFFTRIVIAILIFLTPTFVNLILYLANSVWKFISPNSCGLF